MSDVVVVGGHIFRPYIWKCEARRCKRLSRDISADAKPPYFHPECAPKKRGK